MSLQNTLTRRCLAEGSKLLFVADVMAALKKCAKHTHAQPLTAAGPEQDMSSGWRAGVVLNARTRAHTQRFGARCRCQQHSCMEGAKHDHGMSGRCSSARVQAKAVEQRQLRRGVFCGHDGRRAHAYAPVHRPSNPAPRAACRLDSACARRYGEPWKDIFMEQALVTNPCWVVAAPIVLEGQHLGAILWLSSTR